MIETLYEKMMIPESCRLGKRVYKKLFHENAKLSATDKKALSDDVDTIFWQYTFKPTTIPIQPYEDDQREYHEVALLQVNLKQTDRVNRLAEIIHRAIPYPLLVVFVSNTDLFNQPCLQAILTGGEGSDCRRRVSDDGLAGSGESDGTPSRFSGKSEHYELAPYAFLCVLQGCHGSGDRFGVCRP